MKSMNYCEYFNMCVAYLIFASEKDLIQNEEVDDFLFSRLSHEMSWDYLSYLTGLLPELNHIFTYAYIQ